MNRPLLKPVLNLTEAAKFLCVSAAKVRKLAETGQVPARKVANEWRFLRSALEDWLRGKPDPTQALLRQAGLFKGDESMREILREIYRARGRPEDGELAAGTP
jgi:excisionase family DNA binding protein